MTAIEGSYKIIGELNEVKDHLEKCKEVARKYQSLNLDKVLDKIKESIMWVNEDINSTESSLKFFKENNF